MSKGPVSWTTTHGDKVEVWEGAPARGLTESLEVEWTIQWRWRRTARNGRLVATSGEGYTRYTHCRRMAERVNPKEET